MSRKHYIAVAAKIERRVMSVCTDGEMDVIGGIARDLADIFADDNPSFDRRRFLDACGVSA